MRSLLIAAGALALFGSSAMADDVVIKPVLPGVIVEHRAADEGTTTSKTVRHNDGCTTHSVTRSNDDNGNSVTRTKTNC